MAGNTRNKVVVRALLLTVAWLIPLAVLASEMDEMSLERWAKLREAERYQLQVAERYYRQPQPEWKAALAEYEKYLALYEKSEGAPFAQLKWGLCQIKLRKANTAIKDGFETLLDYWPESPEAPLAKYYIGQTYKNMGQTANAKKAYYGLLKDHPQTAALPYALADLVEIVDSDADVKAQVELWKKLTFEVKRTDASLKLCKDATKKLAGYSFSQLLFEDGVKALATSYAPEELSPHVVTNLKAPLEELLAAADTKSRGDRLAESAVSYFRGKAGAPSADPEAKKAAQQQWFCVAAVYALARQDTKVLDAYAQMRKSFGSDDETLGRLAAFYESRARYEDAYRTYRSFQDKAAGLSLMAASCRQRKQYETAVTAYREASLHDKTGPIRYLAEAGATYREAGKVKDAVATYDQIRGHDAANAVKWLGEIATTYRRVGQYKEAVATYQELMRIDSTNTPNWLWLIGTAYQEAGQLKEAIGTYRQCTNFPENYRRMAQCHRYLHQYPEALMLYNQIAGSDAGAAPGAMYDIGLTWEEAGKPEHAVKAFQQLCRRFPKDGQASQAHARLQDKYKISETLGGAKDE